MTANAQVQAFLQELNGYTNSLAAAQNEQTEKIAEIAADIDALIASQGGSLSPEVQEQLAEASATLRSVVEFEVAQSATLQAVAAQNDQPLPEPVEP